MRRKKKYIKIYFYKIDVYKKKKIREDINVEFISFHFLWMDVQS